MGSCNSKKEKKIVADKGFFNESKLIEQQQAEERIIRAKPDKKRQGKIEPPIVSLVDLTDTRPGPAQPPPVPVTSRSYDEEAIDRMRHQLKNDSEAFLLNNILLSVQFFENYERYVL